MKKKIVNDEIDLIEIIITIWNDKFKAILIVLIFFSLTLGYNFYKSKIFVATTKIKPISIFEENLYNSYNTILDDIKINNKIEKLKFNLINKKLLQELFLAKIQDNKVIRDTINKFQIINKKNFKSEALYDEAVEQLAYQLKILAPIYIKSNDRSNDESNDASKNWRIQFKINDKIKWVNALEYLNIKLNNEIKEELINQFKIQKQTVLLQKKFRIEDLNNKIFNAKYDYEIETKERLAFLNEQAEIARELGIKNSTLEVQDYNSKSTVISSIQTNNEYYMRGYAMIEKEIELINSRSNKDDFIENLFELKKELRNIVEDKNLIRLEKLFFETPIIKSNNFKAANIIYQNTKFENFDKLDKIRLLMSIIIGLVFGIFYVFISRALLQRK